MFPPRLFLVYCLYFAVALVLAHFICKRRQVAALAPKTAQWLLGSLVVLHALYYFTLYMFNFYNFRAGGTDLLTFSQSLWNLAQGDTPFLSHQQTHLLRDHFSPIWYLLVHVFKLLPYNELIVASTVGAVSSVAIFIYLISRQFIKSEWLALALAVSYLLNPYVQYSQLAAGHADSYAALLIMASLFFIIKEKWYWLAITMALALICKEDVGLYFIGVGAYIYFYKKKRWHGAVTALIGLVYSVTVVKWVMPLFGPDTLNLLDRYFGELGTSHEEILRNILLKPWILITPFLNWEKVFSLFYILSQTGWVVVLSGWAVLPLAISLGFRSVTNYTAMYNYWDHYFLMAAPFYYFASIAGVHALLDQAKLQWLKNKITPLSKITPVSAALFILLFGLLINLERGQNILSRKFDPVQFTISEHNQIGNRLIRLIPEGAPVLVMEPLASRFSFRKETHVISVYAPWDPARVPLAKIEYVVMDMNYPMPDTWMSIYRHAKAWLDAQKHFRIIAHQDGWVIYRKN